MVTLLPTRRVGAASWRIAWSSDLADPTYDVYVNGALVRQQKTNTLVVSGDYIDTYLVEVVDDGLPPGYAGGNRSELAFNSDPNAERYSIEYDGGSGYSKVAELPAGGGRERMRTHPLNDQATHGFRVTPVRPDGTLGTPAVVSGKTVRHADVPIATFTYSAGPGTVTIS